MISAGEKYRASLEHRAMQVSDELPAYLDHLLEKWTQLEPGCPEALLVKPEYMNALSLVRALTRLRMTPEKADVEADRLIHDPSESE